jgi:subtilisin family serine protease
MRAIRALVPVWIFIVCFVLSGLVQAEEARQSVAPPSPDAAKPRAFLRFYAPVYKAGDCALLSLTMLAGAAADAGASPPTVEIAVADGGHATGRVTLPMRSAGNGRYSLSGCVHLVASAGTAKGPSLPVQAGSVLGALARNSKGDTLAVALAVVPARSGTGRMRFTAERGASGAGHRTDRDQPDTLTDGQGKTISFLRNRVIVLERDRGELTRFLARRHGHIVATLGKHHLVDVDPRTADPAHLEPLAELLGGVPGQYRFSSQTALDMGALLVEELAGGLAISLDFLTHNDVVPQTAEQGGADHFKSKWFNPTSPTTSGVKLAEGMALGSLFLVPSTPDIPIAFVDNGFAGPDDFPTSKPAVVKDYGGDPSSSFVDIPQCDAGLISTALPGGNCSWMTLKPEAAGPGPSGNPTWHGAHVASVALSTWNDFQGTAGVAFPVARPYLIKIGSDQFGIARGITRAIPDISGPSARIISLSNHENCIQKLALFTLDVCSAVQDGLASGVACLLLQILFPELSAVPCAEIAALITLGEALNSISGPVKDAEARGLLVVSSASNDLSEDVNDMGTVPCTLKNVICVGGMDVDLTRVSAKGSSISIYAPARRGLAMQAPDNTSTTSAPLFEGTSYAVPVVSGSLALALSINPLLTTDEARNLLRDSACRSAHPNRLDGSSCSPSTDSEVDKVGYIDLLELVRLARISARQNPLMSCTGGWDAEEAGDKTDDFRSAISLPTLNPAIRAISDFRPVKPDLSIHKIRKGPTPTLDEDWYKVSLGPTASGSVEGFVARFSFKVDDPSLGVLSLEVWHSNPCGGPPIQVPPGDVLDSENSKSGAGEAHVTARVRSDLTYFMRVIGAIQVSGLRIYGGNCYKQVHVEVTDIGRVPSASCQ